MDVRLIARYPFLKESGKLMKVRGINLDDLVSDIAYERARFLGKNRILTALEEGEIPEPPLANEQEALLELLSYPIARMLTASIQDPYLTRRYALSEAVSAHQRLSKEDASFLNMVAEELGVDLRIENNSAKMHFSDFLRHTRQLRGKNWKLVNHTVDRGYVVLTKTKSVRIIQNVIQKKIEDELEAMQVNELILGSFEEDLAEIKSIIEDKKKRFKAENLGRVRITRFPPCMYQLLATVQAGENVPHTGRFALVSFLHNLKMSNEEIFSIFATIPDFDEAKTRYQIQHITGKISATEYTPPECSTMKSYGLCPGPDETCARIRHPLSYYRLKARGEKQRRTEAPPKEKK